MALPYSEDFTGTNGDPWSGDWATAVSGGTGVVDIQSNTGRFNLNTAGGYADWNRALLDDQGAADFDLTVDLLISQQGLEYYPVVAFRTDGTWSGAYPANGYCFQFRSLASNAWEVERVSSGSRTTLDGPNAYTATVGDTIHINVLCDGGDVECRIWKNSESKPGTASFAFTDSTYPTQTRHGLAVEGPAASGVTHVVAWDNLAIDPLTATVTGTATGSFEFAAPAAATVTVDASAAATLVFTAPAVGSGTASGTAASSFSFAAPVAGTVSVGGDAPVLYSDAAAFLYSDATQVYYLSIQATTALSFAAPTSGTVTRVGTAAAAVSFTAAAVGLVTVEAAAVAAVSFAAPAAGTPTRAGTAATALAFAAPAAGTVTHPATAATALAFAGPALGVQVEPGSAATDLTFSAPALGDVVAQGAGSAATSLAFTAPAAGQVSRFGTAAAAFSFAGPGAGTVTAAGTADASWAFTAPAAGTGTVEAAAASTFAFAAPADGELLVDTNLVDDWDFESGSFAGNGWTEVDSADQVEVTTDASRPGFVYGERFTPSASAHAYARRTLDPLGANYRFTWWSRVDATFNTAPATVPSNAGIFLLQGDFDVLKTRVRLSSDNTLILNDHVVSGSSSSTATITRDVWQRYDIWVDGDGTADCDLRVYVDGVLFCELLGRDWSAGSDITSMRYGFHVGTPVLDPTGHMDWSNIQLWSPGGVTATASTTLTFGAAAAGTVTHSATATTALAFAVTAAGEVTVEATAATSFAFAAPVAATVAVAGQATTTLAFAAAATGSRTVTAAAATTVAFTAPAAGDVSGVVEGEAVAVFLFAAVVTVGVPVILAERTSTRRPDPATTSARRDLVAVTI